MVLRHLEQVSHPGRSVFAPFPSAAPLLFSLMHLRSEPFDLGFAEMFLEIVTSLSRYAAL